MDIHIVEIKKLLNKISKGSSDTENNNQSEEVTSNNDNTNLGQ